MVDFKQSPRRWEEDCCPLRSNHASETCSAAVCRGLRNQDDHASLIKIHGVESKPEAADIPAEICAATCVSG